MSKEFYNLPPGWTKLPTDWTNSKTDLCFALFTGHCVKSTGLFVHYIFREMEKIKQVFNQMREGQSHFVTKYDLSGTADCHCSHFLKPCTQLWVFGNNYYERTLNV